MSDDNNDNTPTTPTNQIAEANPQQQQQLQLQQQQATNLKEEKGSWEDEIRRRISTKGGPRPAVFTNR